MGRYHYQPHAWLCRFVGQGITQATWSNACDPRDGNPLGSDW